MVSSQLMKFLVSIESLKLMLFRSFLSLKTTRFLFREISDIGGNATTFLVFDICVIFCILYNYWCGLL